MRSLVRAPFVAVKRTFKVPSSVVVAGTAARPLDCSRRSPNDLLGRRPASFGRANHACAAAGVDGHAARVRREVGERPLSSTPTESVVARVALGGPPAPPPSPRHPIPRTAQKLAAHRPAHRRSEIEKQHASSCRGRACTVAICQSTSSLQVACALWNTLVLCFAVHQG